VEWLAQLKTTDVDAYNVFIMKHRALSGGRGKKRSRIDVAQFIEERRSEKSVAEGDHGVYMNYESYIRFYTGQNPAGLLTMCSFVVRASCVQSRGMLLR